MAPTWETNKQARTFVLGVPAPRGQITDRHGNPLAQTRVSYNLAISFPTPLAFSDAAVLEFAHRQMALAHDYVRREFRLPDVQILKHYHNRGMLPLDFALDLFPAEIEAIRKEHPPNLALHPVYQRFYPNGALAAHLLGYAGRGGHNSEGPIQNNELLWPNAEGREGLEQSFNDQLTGKVGQLNIAFDSQGKKASERIVIPPQPGYTVVTTIDEDIQRMAEQALEKGCQRGAIVILDPNNGDILAMASWPEFNPNAFIPQISAEAFRQLADDPNLPLLPRAFRSAYPPGSTFKVTVGLAALESGSIGIHDEFGCPAALEIGNLTFRNWKKTDSGSMDFAQALTQSCNTFFYQVGMKTGGKTIGDWATKLGFGAKTGIPLASEAEGRIPTDEYMRKVYGRKFLDGDVANFAIGQGDTLISPLQMAQEMATIGNGGTFYQTRLVQQVQSIDNKIVAAYEVRVRNQIDMKPAILAALKKAMVDVVSSRAGTAGKAQVDNVQVAGKTGTAQWGPKNKERTAAWFAGFAPADKPKYAFAALYESNVKQTEVHGGQVAAPIVGKVLRELFKDQAKPVKGSHHHHQKSDEDDENAETAPKVQQVNPDAD